MSLRTQHEPDKAKVSRRTKSAQIIRDMKTPLEPGKIYIGILPGRSKPVYIRKPVAKRTAWEDHCLLAWVKGSYDVKGKRAQSLPQVKEAHQKVGEHPQTSAPQDVKGPHLPLQVEFQQQPQPTFMPLPPYIPYTGYPIFAPPAPYGASPSPQIDPPGPTRDTAKHHRTGNVDLIYRCVSCHKFRSPGYHYRHPLEPGQEPSPSFCRKCAMQFTSSEESEDSEQENHPRRKKSGVQGGRRSDLPGKGEKKGDENADVPGRGPRPGDLPPMERDEEYVSEPFRPHERSRQPPHHRAPPPPRCDLRAEHASPQPLYRHVPRRSGQHRDERGPTNSQYSDEHEVNESLERTHLEPGRKSRGSRRSGRGRGGERDGRNEDTLLLPGTWKDT